LSITNPELLQDLLCCPTCHARLQQNAAYLHCAGCQARYPVVDGVPQFVESSIPPRIVSTERWLVQLKNQLKAFPKLYEFLTDICSPVLMAGKSRAILLNRLPPTAVILNLGSGTRRISSSVIQVDYLPLAGVDVVADVAHLPFPDCSVDGVISEATLEHVRDRQCAIDEMRRVLKPGGYLYIIVPFLVGYHASPDDYYRWTRQGLLADLHGIDPIEIGVRSGPTSALLWVLQEWFAMSLSFNITFLYQVLLLLFMLMTFPLKVLDIILNHYGMAWKIAATYYYLGRKT